MPLSAVPDQPLDVLDPVVHAACVVEIAAMAVRFNPGPIAPVVSPNCGLRWSQVLGRFDVELVCTLPADHLGTAHAALDCDGVSHGTVIDERMCA